MKNIAIFASGSGTNAENIISHFAKSKNARVKLIICNRKDAGVFERAENKGVESVYMPKSLMYKNNTLLSLLIEKNIDFVVLAGFLLLIPSEVIHHFEKKIVNIHPALLPKYGGKGMYGENVHNAVIKNGEKISGITIHYVNEAYDEGDIIFQAQCDVLPGDDAESLASKIHDLEYKYFPGVIDSVLKDK